jgi:hypothetical protein
MDADRVAVELLGKRQVPTEHVLDRPLPFRGEGSRECSIALDRTATSPSAAYHPA